MSQENGGPSPDQMGLKPDVTGLPKHETTSGDPVRDHSGLTELKPLYRGVWADQLQDGMDLPMGGSLLHDRMTLKLRLDFATFEPQLERWTTENVRALYEKNKDGLKEWLKAMGSDMDPYTFHVCVLVQKKMQVLLDVNLPEETVNAVARDKHYSEEQAPKLSELKGKTMCGERAAMGQYLLQRIGLKSAYVGGITMENARDGDEYPEGHSYLVVQDMTDNVSSYVFDIARPRSQHNLPRVLQTDVPITWDLLKGQSDLLVRTQEVLQGGEWWYGVGAPAAGKHKVIEKTK